MMYRWCRVRHHRIVKHKYQFWHWCGCLDCGRQWTYYGSIGAVWSRPLDFDTETQVMAELAGIELPPLWRDFGHDAVTSKVRG